jgi:hypothetical protein
MSQGSLSIDDRQRRVLRVLAGAKRLADPSDPLGREARLTLPQATGLSPAGVELGLARHLETEVTAEDLARLIARAGTAPRVQVVLSANVFVGAVRAVALAVAASPVVFVRASSRESVMAPLLDRATREEGREEGKSLFELTDEVASSAGDEIHVYGRSETIAEIARESPAGVHVRGHGPGFGVALIDPAVMDLDAAAEKLSWDVVAFDQRGCLSPRMAMVVGPEADTGALAELLARELEKREHEVPRGVVGADERESEALYRQTAHAVGRCHTGATYTVGSDIAARALLLPPPGRHVHVARVEGADDVLRLLAPFAGAVTCVGLARESPYVAALLTLVPRVRLLELGKMQSPPLDGPVDLREMVSSFT